MVPFAKRAVSTPPRLSRTCPSGGEGGGGNGGGSPGSSGASATNGSPDEDEGPPLGALRSRQRLHQQAHRTRPVAYPRRLTPRGQRWTLDLRRQRLAPLARRPLDVQSPHRPSPRRRQHRPLFRPAPQVCALARTAQPQPTEEPAQSARAMARTELSAALSSNRYHLAEIVARFAKPNIGLYASAKRPKLST